MQYGQPYPHQAQQQTQQQAPYTQPYPPQQQAPYTQPYPPQQQTSYTQVQVFTNSQPTGGGPTKSKVAAGLLAIFFGYLGAHKFYLGHTGAGVLILLLNLFLWWTIIVPAIIELVCFIEGIIYLVKSDEEFQRDCVRG